MFVAALTLIASVAVLAVWFGYQLFKQHGRILERLEALEQAVAQAPGTRLADSRLKRDGLTPGTPAPDFVIARLDSDKLSIAEYRGRRVVLVFSDPDCAPCMALAPQLEKRARRFGVQVVMVSRGGAEANRAKVAEHGLTFPVGLQEHWEISKLYAMFATPIGYLIDEGGVIAAPVAVGPERILALLSDATVAGKPAAGNGVGRWVS